MQDIAASEAEILLKGDLNPLLPGGVREAMLDLILAFADLDSSVAFITAMTKGLNPREGADQLGRKSIGDKLKIAVSALKAGGRHADAAILQEVRDEYPDRSKLRNRIAHHRCAGVRKSDPSRVIFLPYEGEGPPNSLAVEVYGPQAFADDRLWAQQMHQAFMHIVDRHGFFSQAP